MENKMGNSMRLKNIIVSFFTKDLLFIYDNLSQQNECF